VSEAGEWFLDKETRSEISDRVLGRVTD
jgi:hypothetical protein